MSAYHTPVMVDEVVSALRVKASGKYIDCTTGEGGHSLAILEAAKPPPSILCLDVDAEALQTARRRLEAYGDEATLRRANYGEVAAVARENGFAGADGLLLDVGLSSLQLDKGERGFSFRHDAPLDMRFDVSQAVAASEIVNGYEEGALADVIYRYGEGEKIQTYRKGDSSQPTRADDDRAGGDSFTLRWKAARQDSSRHKDISGDTHCGER